MTKIKSLKFSLEISFLLSYVIIYEYSVHYWHLVENATLNRRGKHPHIKNPLYSPT